MDSVLSLQLSNAIQIELTARIKMFEKGENALFCLFLAHHHMRVEVATEDDLAVVSNHLVNKQAENLNLYSVLYLLRGEVETGENERSFVCLLDGLELFVGEAEGDKGEAFAPVQKALLLDIVEHWLEDCSLFWLQFR